MTGEDAEMAVREGVAAVWVSNHGGRQLDTSLAVVSIMETITNEILFVFKIDHKLITISGMFMQIEVLPDVVSAVQGRVEVYVDGGVRLGTDVLKAIALGARAVFVGRPAIWGLACKVNISSNAYQAGVLPFPILLDNMPTILAFQGIVDPLQPKFNFVNHIA